MMNLCLGSERHLLVVHSVNFMAFVEDAMIHMVHSRLEQYHPGTGIAQISFKFEAIQQGFEPRNTWTLNVRTYCTTNKCYKLIRLTFDR